jgi:hypothetical protein
MDQKGGGGGGGGGGGEQDGFICARCKLNKKGWERHLSKHGLSLEGPICLGCFFKPPLAYTAPKFGYPLDYVMPGFKCVSREEGPTTVRCKQDHVMKDYKDSFPLHYQPNTPITCDGCKQKNVALDQHYFHCDTCTDFDFCALCAQTLSS